LKGTVSRRCGCRDPQSGRKLGDRCPRLSNARHGSWSFTVELPPGADGKRRRVRKGGYDTQRAATAARSALVERVRTGARVEPGRRTVGQLLDEWLAGRVGLRPSTARGHADAVRLYLKPALGAITLDRLDAADIAALYAAMRVLGQPLATDSPHHDIVQALLAVRRDPTGRSPRPLSAGSIRRVHAVLHAALQTAVRRRELAHNPADHVELVSAASAPARVWTPEQVGAFLDGAAEHRLAPLFHVVAYQGLRRGEGCGLLWSALDLDAAELRIGRQTVQVGKEMHDGAPKTRAGSRVIALDAETVTVLRAHRKRVLEEKLAWGPAYDDGGLVFCKENGTPYKPESVSQQFERLVGRLGLPPITLHQLRHTSASIGLAAGESLKEVSDRLGHSTITITADIYTHVLPATARESARRRSAAIPRAGSRSLGHTTATPGPSGSSEAIKVSGESPGQAWSRLGESNSRPAHYE
jgi:integrase